MDSSATVEGGTPSVTPEPSYPNARPGEKPPARPVDILSDAGAEAFAVYFVKTLDWAYATMDTTLLKDASTAACSFCEFFVNTVDSKRQLGDVYIGSRIVIHTAEVLAGPDDTSRLTNLAFSYSALSIRHADGTSELSGDAQALVQLNIRVSFLNSKWSAYDAKRVVQE